MFGTTSQPGNGGPQGKPFYDPHSGFSFFFNGMPFQNSWSKPGEINYRFYYKTVLPESYEKPYLIEIISDWCFACKLIIRSWYNIWHISMTCCGKTHCKESLYVMWRIFLINNMARLNTCEFIWLIVTMTLYCTEQDFHENSLYPETNFLCDFFLCCVVATCFWSQLTHWSLSSPNVLTLTLSLPRSHL